jgi:hypothetical protein
MFFGIAFLVVYLREPLTGIDSVAEMFQSRSRNIGQYRRCVLSPSAGQQHEDGKADQYRFAAGAEFGRFNHSIENSP